MAGKDVYSFGILKGDNVGEVSKIDICGNTFYRKDCGMNLVEYNPTLEIQSSGDSFWRVDEIEYKINIFGELEFGFEDFRRLFEDSDIGGFSSGEVESCTSYERYLQIGDAEKKDYLVLLGKRGWNRKRAIKSKSMKCGEILTRGVRICEYSKGNLEEIVYEKMGRRVEGVEIMRMPAFYKRKERVVFIDRRGGFVFGVSYSEAKLQRKGHEKFNQIEVEFWSQVVKDGADIDIKEYERGSLKSHKELVKEVKKRIEGEGFNVRRGGRKYEWLSRFEEDFRGFRLDEL